MRSRRPYQYKIPRGDTPNPAPSRTAGVTEKEVLSGEVQGQPASDIEERFANALYKNKRVSGFDFQPSYCAGRNLTGEIRLDFAVYAPLLNPVQIDGEWIHRSAAQKAEDADRDARLMEELPRGTAYVVHVSGADLETQEEADALVMEMF